MSFNPRKLDSRFQVRTGAVGTAVIASAGEEWVAAPAASAAPAAAGAAVAAADDKAAAGREKSRLISSHGPRIETTGKIGGEFSRTKGAAFLASRLVTWERFKAEAAVALAAKPHDPIRVTLPDGKVVEAVAFETTPLDIANGISKALGKRACVARVVYTRRVAGSESDTVVHAEEEDEDADKPDISHLLNETELKKASSPNEVWDLTRPLEGDCFLELLDFDTPEGRSTFWHSSAHVLGQALERELGVKLTMGPPTKDGFYYDAYMGKDSLREVDLPTIDKAADTISKEKQPFERLVLSRAQALELFADNPFKVQIISAKIPEGALTTAYRCGHLVDLCTGPHLPDTSRVGAFQTMKTSAAFWLGSTDNDALQRVYAVAYPDSKQLKKHLKDLEDAKKFDHRTVGAEQSLFFFHELSPGSCFFLPHGARVFRCLQQMIREQYWRRGFHEVVTPNMFNLDLWKISGHAEHYLENMFTFDIEGQKFGLKPMNCPAHCLMFKHRMRSFRELPLRIADFGVLHRNEFSGALTGLTRVRRFQQDDAHIFCRQDQIEDEVNGALDFMASIYETLGFTFELDLSTKPAKAMGDDELWKRAELMMKTALERFGRPWSINPGDGAFYGPKIDVKVYDALGRRHQCATIQLDFQLPIRFDLKFRSGRASGPADEAAADASAAAAAAAATPAGPPGSAPAVLEGDFERPVIIHRAVLGSVERMIAVLTEHLKGKWPFWLSPRQVSVVPVDPHPELMAYARTVTERIHAGGFYVDIEDSNKTLPKKIRESQLAQYNLILVVGWAEVKNESVNVRTRDNITHGEFRLDEFVATLQSLQNARSDDFIKAAEAAGVKPIAAPAAKGADAAASAGDA